MIVTPFAQILASLKNVRQNFINLSNISNEKYNFFSYLKNNNKKFL
jgi:hypothetical protein